jgi:hypothetical protein
MAAAQQQNTIIEITRGITFSDIITNKNILN